jgi:gamma-glutamylcyclotransferase (GGCT)/AIG2-like uncharacterized protein YtfP
MSAAVHAAPTYLFVYGTLMSRARGALGASQRARLGRDGTSLGAATIAGAPPAGNDVVHGELFRLDRPDGIISWLDSYEGIPAEPTPNDEYARVLVSARLASGEDVAAWVYRYRGKTSGFPAIASGRWDG